MLGKSMRCPLASCRKIFPVEQVNPSPLIELLPAEIAPPESPQLHLDWIAAPPPVRDRIPTPSSPPEQPKVVSLGSWDVPPIRRDPSAPVSEALPSSEKVNKPKKSAKGEPVASAVSTSEMELTPVTGPRSRWAGWIVYPFLILVVVGGGVGGAMLWRAYAQSEKRLAESADADYEKALYNSASQKYANVAKHFPDSESRPRYDFRARLADIRAKVHNEPDTLDDLLADLEQLMTEFDGKPLLNEHASDVGDTLVKLLVDFAKRGLDDPDAAKSLAELKEGKVDDVIRRAKNIKPTSGARPVAWADVAEAKDKLEKKAELARQRKQVLDLLAQLVQDPSYASLRQAERLIESEKARFPDLPDSEPVRAAFEAIYKGHLASVRYVREGATVAAGEEDDEPALLVGPLLAGTPGQSNSSGSVLALARGVLYGLDANHGRIRWARRVGIDTTTLPVRVPSGAFLGDTERVLALSSDTSTLTALDPADGSTLWTYKLGTPSLGRPAVIGLRAYLATYSGEVHEIELAEGRLLGRYLLGHRLTAGGTHETGTNRLYVPADDGCVYVLRVGSDPGCEMILYTRHPAASLRGEPVVVPASGDASGYLILNQTAGLRSTDLKVYDLPLSSRDAQPRVLKPRAEMDGWTWFPPSSDPEKLVMLTDDGMLGVFGIKQAGTGDQPLFPLLPEGGLRLATLNREVGTPGRSAVIQVQGNDYWTLALGRLQRLRLVWDVKEGPKLVPVWRDAPLVGSPLHEGQATENGSRLVLVTQPSRRSTCWATCVDEQRGEIRWRRQLGLVCQGEPTSIPMPSGGPLLLAQDQGGALFAIDPSRFKVGPEDRWISAGNMQPLADSLDDNSAWPPTVLTSEDGKTRYVVANPGGGKTLIVRKITEGTGRTLQVEERKIELTGPLAGPPALAGNFLAMPLADSDTTLVRVPMSENAAVEEGPNWRLARAAADAHGFVLGLGDDRLLTTDGGRGLTVWKWPAGMPQTVLPTGRDSPTLELPGRVLSVPVRLPGKDVRFLVADPQGLSLIVVEADGALTVKRRWSLAGITTGPIVIPTSGGPRVAVVVGKSRLAWIDPEISEPLWTHVRENGDALIGLPYLHGELVVIADSGGRYVGLKLADGTPIGPGYTLRGSIAPACGVVGFNSERLMCPLTDGTLLLLDAGKLGK